MCLILGAYELASRSNLRSTYVEVPLVPALLADLRKREVAHYSTAPTVPVPRL